MTPIFDEKDAAILAEREAKMLACEGPRIGHFVRFADGMLCRMSLIHRYSDTDEVDIQTSRGGSFYLGENGFVDFSGGLNSSVPLERFTKTAEKMLGSVWFFHHGHRAAHNGVQAKANFPVWECDTLPDFILSF